MAISISEQIKAEFHRLFPRPWRMEWKGTNPPLIVADNGRTVAVVTTGTIEGAYSSEVILQLTDDLLAPPLPEPVYKALEERLRIDYDITNDFDVAILTQE